MTDAQIFMLGIFVSSLLFGGLAFTIYEVNRLYREEEASENHHEKAKETSWKPLSVL